MYIYSIFISIIFFIILSFLQELDKIRELIKRGEINKMKFINSGKLKTALQKKTEKDIRLVGSKSLQSEYKVILNKLTNKIIEYNIREININTINELIDIILEDTGYTRKDKSSRYIKRILFGFYENTCYLEPYIVHSPDPESIQLSMILNCTLKSEFEDFCKDRGVSMKSEVIKLIKETLNNDKRRHGRY